MTFVSLKPLQRMKKVFAFAVLCLALAGTLTSCSNNSPKGVVSEYMDCLKNKDAKGLIELLDLEEDMKDEDPVKAKEELTSLINDKVLKELDKKGGIKSYKITSEKIDEEKGTATVGLKITYGDGEESESESKLIKDKNGKWKVPLEGGK